MTQSTDYGTVPTAIQNIVANKCQLLDQYILFQTGDNQYSALIHNPVTKETTQYVFSRTNNYNQYSVSKSAAEWDFTVRNEYYCYSNVGYGAALDLPVVEGLTAHASAAMVCVLFLAIMFKGVLFPCLRKR